MTMHDASEYITKDPMADYNRGMADGLDWYPHAAEAELEDLATYSPLDSTVYIGQDHSLATYLQRERGPLQVYSGVVAAITPPSEYGRGFFTALKAKRPDLFLPEGHPRKYAGTEEMWREEVAMMADSADDPEPVLGSPVAELADAAHRYPEGGTWERLANAALGYASHRLRERAEEHHEGCNALKRAADEIGPGPPPF